MVNPRKIKRKEEKKVDEAGIFLYNKSRKTNLRAGEQNDSKSGIV